MIHLHLPAYSLNYLLPFTRDADFIEQAFVSNALSRLLHFRTNLIKLSPAMGQLVYAVSTIYDQIKCH